MRQITFRPLSDKDSGWLMIWMNSPHIKQAWTHLDTTPEDEVEEALSLIGSSEGAAFIIELNRKPVGYIQYYDPNYTDSDFYFSGQPTGALGLDLFIGDVSLTGQGLGAEALRQFSNDLLAKGAPKLLIDPSAENSRAIRAFEKAGFTTYKQHDSSRWGRVVLMSRTPDLPELLH